MHICEYYMKKIGETQHQNKIYEIRSQSLFNQKQKLNG